jgi:threonine aldolase
VSEGLVDLRSDTVTRPTARMRRAMAEAEVGDDGYGEDPTVNELEARYAERVGKPAAVFVPSGTMANQIALRILSVPGTRVVAGRSQHMVAYELGAGPRNAGIQFHPVDDKAGVLGPDALAWAKEAERHHQPPVSLVCIENTHMASGGIAWRLEELKELDRVADGLPIHMDGARLFNAEVATGVSAVAMASSATTVMSCLSKGLCAPVGSLLAGSEAHMAAARDERKRLGGGMRQAGVLAAAGLIALDEMVNRLVDDHLRARRLGEAVAERWPEKDVDPKRVESNIVVFHHAGANALLAHLAEQGVLCGTIAPGLVRLVTHHDVDDDDIDRAVRAIATAPDEERP